MNEHYIESMGKAVERLVAEKDSITGVVITSAKKTFFAGGDLKGMIQAGPRTPASSSHGRGDQENLRTLETSASRSWPRSTPHWAVAWRSCCIVITGSSPT